MATYGTSQITSTTTGVLSKTHIHAALDCHRRPSLWRIQDELLSGHLRMSYETLATDIDAFLARDAQPRSNQSRSQAYMEIMTAEIVAAMEAGSRFPWRSSSTPRLARPFAEFLPRTPPHAGMETMHRHVSLHVKLAGDVSHACFVVLGCFAYLTICRLCSQHPCLVHPNGNTSPPFLQICSRLSRAEVVRCTAHQ